MKFDAKNASVEELVNRYHFKIHAEYRDGKYVLTDRIYTHNAPIIMKDDAHEIIKERKDEIYAYLLDIHNAEIKAEEERQEKIKAIEGLKELEFAREDIAAWHEEFAKSFDHVGGLGVRPRPNHDLKALAEKYPRASAYLKAESWSYAANYEKAAAGKKALERIINGEDYALALSNMEAEWSKACESHIWD